MSATKPSHSSLPLPFLSLPLFFLSLSSSSTLLPPPPTANLLLPSDAVYLLSFKSKADLDNKLLYALHERFDYCQWRGVKCFQGRVIWFALQSSGLRGTFLPDTLSRLDQLRVLNLQNNSLFGPVPDLSSLVNLKSLFLGRNSFSGAFPPSILYLHRLLNLDLSYNNFSGFIPVGLSRLDRLASLRLQRNHFSGTIPPLNQSFLKVLNVTGNNLTGPIPNTLWRFNASSFLLNPDLCGEIINRVCKLPSPFFGSPKNSTPQSKPPPNDQTTQSQNVFLSPQSPKKHKKTGLILGFSIGFTILITILLCIFGFIKIQRNQTGTRPLDTARRNPIQTQIEENREPQTKFQIAEEITRVEKNSGKLIFCAGEAELYSLEQLMRASAELLGRGTIGSTYKAVMSNQIVVTVKRINGDKREMMSSEVFMKEMEVVGGLRHPNLVPVRAYFQAKGEGLVVYDYQPNGSLFNLIHDSRSSRAKPLHWTSCLKIAEDVAQGLAYIHQASKLIHGNLKSSNVLLGPDFEACLTDYGLSLLANSSSYEDPDSAAYKAPETRNSTHQNTLNSDVYAFGVLLLELLTGKRPSQHPLLLPNDVSDWVRAMRDTDGCGENDRLEMLTEVASACSLTSPEQRPTMRQVLKMILKIKETWTMDE